MKLGIIELHDSYDFDSPIALKQLVRCGECKHGQDDLFHMFCAYHHHKTYADDFCSYGSRSEKPNNCEPQTEVEMMSCAECKHRPIGAEICEEACHYEPQTDWHYDEQDATWYPYKHEDEPQTEPLPKTINGVKIADAVAWADKWLEDNSGSEMWDMIRTLRDATEWQDEPQTDCAWK